MMPNTPRFSTADLVFQTAAALYGVSQFAPTLLKLIPSIPVSLPDFSDIGGHEDGDYDLDSSDEHTLQESSDLAHEQTGNQTLSDAPPSLPNTLFQAYNNWMNSNDAQSGDGAGFFDGMMPSRYKIAAGIVVTIGLYLAYERFIRRGNYNYNNNKVELHIHKDGKTVTQTVNGKTQQLTLEPAPSVSEGDSVKAASPTPLANAVVVSSESTQPTKEMKVDESIRAALKVAIPRLLGHPSLKQSNPRFYQPNASIELQQALQNLNSPECRREDLQTAILIFEDNADVDTFNLFLDGICYNIDAFNFVVELLEKHNELNRKLENIYRERHPELTQSDQGTQRSMG